MCCILQHSNSQMMSGVHAFCIKKLDDVWSWYVFNQQAFKRIVFYSIPAHRWRMELIRFESTSFRMYWILQHSSSQTTSGVDTFWIKLSIECILQRSRSQTTSGVDIISISKLLDVVYFTTTGDVWSWYGLNQQTSKSAHIRRLEFILFESTSFQMSCILQHSNSPTTSGVDTFWINKLANMLYICKLVDSKRINSRRRWWVGML